MSKTYIIPREVYIGSTAEKLYTLESKRTVAIGNAATELSRVLGHEKADLWNKTIPQTLFDTLGGYEQPAAIAAAIGFLRHYGFTVSVEGQHPRTDTKYLVSGDTVTTSYGS